MKMVLGNISCKLETIYFLVNTSPKPLDSAGAKVT